MSCYNNIKWSIKDAGTYRNKNVFLFWWIWSPAILGHHGKNLLENGLTSKTFSVGYVQTPNPHELLVNLEKLRKELSEDEYLSGIPSIKTV